MSIKKLTDLKPLILNKMTNQNKLIIGIISTVVVGGVAFFFYNKMQEDKAAEENAQLKQAGEEDESSDEEQLIASVRKDLKLTDAQARRVVAFAHSQILNRADGKNEWRDNVAKKADVKGISIKEMATRDALFHLKKHNKLND